MASPPTRKLRTPFEGVLAGGADPSSSALYSFGPFVKVIAAAGAGATAFGTVSGLCSWPWLLPHWSMAW